MNQPWQHLAAWLLLACLTACGPTAFNEGYPWLSELDAGDSVKASGQRLMALAYGLHPLEKGEPAGATEPTALLIGIHGYASEGYEWVYPLKTMDDDSTATYFYRWDYSECPSLAADALAAAAVELAARQGLARIRIVGHSLGGVLASHLVGRQWPVPTEVHVVAAPLAGMSGLNTACSYAPPSGIAEGLVFHQWRTRHELDGAFSSLPVDPQLVSVEGMSVTDLPDEYNGHRLGHNWSISWVADELASKP
ncbi:MAG: alpha/beta hydrolase [Proteobacteria bacterium]|jgi:pimeloyl-ACP methyl ester carboxylesterase|nr:alpha/beta hydrolase [Pseudomonadota bacterium]MDA1301354.1 alpha/beta hydrolase [Pseudomonadota bacterium]